MSPRWLCVFCVLALSAPIALGQEAKDPLRFVPDQAQWVTRVDRPRELLDLVEKNQAFVEAQKLTGVREYYDSTNFQQLYQLIAYFEKQLGKNRNDIIEELSAGGLVIAARVTPPGGAVLIMQSKDEAKLRRFVDLALDVVAKELERQESKDRVVRDKYEGFDVGQIDNKFTFAIADGALVIATDEKALKLALNLQLGKNGQKGIVNLASFAEARKKAPAGALVWTWMHLDDVRKYPQFKNGLDAASLDPLQILLFGGLTDLLKRSPYFTASVTRDGDGYRLGIAMPRGREGMAALSHMILPPDDKGSLAPLLPPRVISSSSFFLDLGQAWEKRAGILGEKNAAKLDEGEKNIGKLLAGIKLSKLLHSMGTHHRLVFAQQKEQPYKTRSATRFPAFALVVDMRDPSFAKDMNGIFRSAALIATFSIGLNLKEEKYKDYEMVSYHFAEGRKVDFDPQNARYNFTPTYVTVGDQFVMSATVELARDLIDVLEAEKKPKSSKATMRTQLYASGLAEIIRANEDATLTQLILSQALPPKTAKEELRAILDWVELLGALRVETTYGANDFRYDILWQPKKK